MCEYTWPYTEAAGACLHLHAPCSVHQDVLRVPSPECLSVGVDTADLVQYSQLGLHFAQLGVA